MTQDLITSPKQFGKLILYKDNNWRSGMGFISSHSQASGTEMNTLTNIIAIHYLKRKVSFKISGY